MTRPGNGPSWNDREPRHPSNRPLRGRQTTEVPRWLARDDYGRDSPWDEEGKPRPVSKWRRRWWAFQGREPLLRRFPKTVATLAVLLAFLVTWALVVVVRGIGGTVGDDPDAPSATGLNFAGPTPATPAADPFAGTPAAGFTEGAAGIVLPTATATGSFTQQQVADGLVAVKEMMVAARLDYRLYQLHMPGQVVGRMAADEQDQVRAEILGGTAQDYATLIGTGAELTRHGPRARGQVTYRAATVDGQPVLEVRARMVWVYAFATVSAPAGIVVVHDDVVWRVPDPDLVDPDDRGLTLGRAVASVANADCDAYARGLLVPKPAARAGGTVPALPAAAFDPARPVDPNRSC